MKIDLHVHTNYSADSIIKPRDLASKSERLGIIPAITDHNTMCSIREMTNLGAAFIPGEEIRTERGDLIGLFIYEKIPKKTSFASALDSIHEQGGLSLLPHMFDTSRSGVIPEKDEIKKIDIVEAFNSRCLDASFNEKADRFADEHKIPKAAGSDCHFLFEFGSTYAEVPDFDLEQPRSLMKSLSNARIFGKTAPFFVRGTTSLIKLLKKG